MRPAAAAALAEAAGRVGNPSSVHGHGQAARAALEEARERLASVLDCDPLEVVLTSGGTESVNLAITGAYRAARGRPDLLVPGGEHAATVETVDALVAGEGARLVPLPVDADARLEPAVLGAALDAHRTTAALVSLLWANNEVGTVNPVPELARLTREAAVPLHVDAVAAFGAIPVSFQGVRRRAAQRLGAQGRGTGRRRRARRAPQGGARPAAARRRPGTGTAVRHGRRAARGRLRGRRRGGRRRPRHRDRPDRPPARPGAGGTRGGAARGRRPRRGSRRRPAPGCRTTCTSRCRAPTGRTCCCCSTPPASR